MKVSVLMAVYNDEEFLSEAVNSILWQTHKDLEFVIVDDGSADGSVRLLQDISDARVKVITQNNQGVAAARNRGLDACSSEIVVHMDADDISYPERVESLLTDWNASGRPDVFGSAADYIDSSGHYLWTYAVPTEHEEIRKQIVAGIGMPLIHPSVLFRKAAVMAVSAYDPSFRKGQDFDLWLRLSDKYRFGNTIRSLIKYRISDQQATAQIDREDGNWFRLLALQKKYLADMGLTDIWENKRERIESVLWQRFLEEGHRNRKILRRTLTELKVKYCGGHKADAIRGAVRLCRSQPMALMKELTSFGKKRADLRAIILEREHLVRYGLMIYA